jgi:hypothetical protein
VCCQHDTLSQAHKEAAIAKLAEMHDKLREAEEQARTEADVRDKHKAELAALAVREEAAERARSLARAAHEKPRAINASILDNMIARIEEQTGMAEEQKQEAQEADEAVERACEQVLRVEASGVAEEVLSEHVAVESAVLSAVQDLLELKAEQASAFVAAEACAVRDAELQASGELAADLLHTVVHHECRALVSEELAEAVKHEQMRKYEEQRVEEEMEKELTAEIVQVVADAECSVLAAEELAARAKDAQREEEGRRAAEGGVTSDAAADMKILSPAEAATAAEAAVKEAEEERKAILVVVAEVTHRLPTPCEKTAQEDAEGDPKMEEDKRAASVSHAQAQAADAKAAEEAALAQATAAAEAAALASAIVVAEEEREGIQGVGQYLWNVSPRYARVVDHLAIQDVIAQVVHDLAAQVERTVQEDAGREMRMEEEKEAASIAHAQPAAVQPAEEAALEQGKQRAEEKRREEEHAQQVSQMLGSMLEGKLVEAFMCLATAQALATPRHLREAIDAAEGTVVAAEAAAASVAQALKKTRDSQTLAEEQREEAPILRLEQNLMLAAEEQRQWVEAKRLKHVEQALLETLNEQQHFFEQEALREQQRVMQLMRSRGSLGLSFPVPACHHSVLLW